MEEIDLLKEINEDLRSSLIDVYEEYVDETKYGKVDVVSSKRTGYDYDQQEKVFHFEKYDRYFAITGYYSSYDGTDFSGEKFVEVKPQQVTVTQYITI